MIKEWFIIVEGRQEGPYSLLELSRDKRITPDTLVWKKGFEKWIAIRNVRELKELFEDKPEGKPLHEKSKEKKPSLLDAEQDTLAISQDPFQFTLWLLVILLILLYLFYQMR